MKPTLSEAAVPRGFRFSATACGLKKTGALDLALLSSDIPASAAAVFTQNLVVAAPVVVSKRNLHLSNGRMRAVIVNAGNANCATGEAGYAASVKMVEETARRLGCDPREVFVCSTGVISARFRASHAIAGLRCALLLNSRWRFAPPIRVQKPRPALSAWRAGAFTLWAAPRVRE
jgi:glutamate N-acetyltransferase/amino-acid N-acetyltransferase